MTTAETDDRQQSLLYIATVSSTIRHFLKPFARHFRDLGWRVDAAASGATTDPGLAGIFDHRYDLPLTRSLREPGAILRGFGVMSALLRKTNPEL